MQNNQVHASTDGFTNDGEKIALQEVSEKNGNVQYNDDVEYYQKTPLITFTGLSKEEVLRYGSDPKWIKIRWVLFFLFWAIWLALLIVSILLIVFSPKCPPRPTMSWWQRDCFYQVDVTKFKDSNGDGIGDLEGLISKVNYLDNIGAKSLFLYRLINPNAPKELDPPIGTIDTLNKLRKMLKEKDMRIVIDIPASYLGKTDKDFEINSKDVIGYWLNNYADGVRLIEMNQLNGLTLEDGPIDKIVYSLRDYVDAIAKKTLKPKLILFDAGDSRLNEKLVKAEPSFLLNRRFTNLLDENLKNPANLANIMTDYYENVKSLDNTWPNIMFNTYDSNKITELGDDAASIAQTITYLSYGTPITLYGDEIRLKHTADILDFMRWDDSPACGFTANQTFANALNSKQSCMNSVSWMTANGAGETYIDFIKNLIQIHKEPSFLWGTFKSMSNGTNTNVYSFVRDAVGFNRFLIAIYTNGSINDKELVNLQSRHDVPLDSVIYHYYSFTNQPNDDFKVNQTISTDRILLKYGDILLLSFPPKN